MAALGLKLAADLAVGLVVLAAAGRDVGALVAVAVSGLAWMPVLGGAALLARRTTDGSVLRWRPSRSFSVPLVAGVGAAAIAQAVLLGMLAGDQGTPLQDAIRTPADLWAVALFAVLAAPLIEEVFFRGYLYAGIASAVGPRLAVILVGLTFGLFHGMQYAGVPAALVAVTVMGLATTWIRMVTGGIWPCVALHGVYNGVGVALLLVTGS